MSPLLCPGTYEDMKSKVESSTLSSEDDPLSGWCDFILYNDSVKTLSNNFVDDIDVLYREMGTSGLKMLYSIFLFDGQVKNGGIEQFFFNYPGSIFSLGDDLSFLKAEYLFDPYSRAVKKVCEVSGSLADARDKWDREGPDFESFILAKQELDLEWFNDLYYDKRARVNGEYKIVERGLHFRLGQDVCDYIRQNQDQFFAA